MRTIFRIRWTSHSALGCLILAVVLVAASRSAGARQLTASQVYLPVITTSGPVYVESSRLSSVYNGPFTPGQPLGEALIHNTLPITVYDVLVEMTLIHTDTGEVVEVVSGTLDLPAVFPGQTATVGLMFGYVSPSDWSVLDVRVRVLGWETERLDSGGQPEVILSLTVLDTVWAGGGGHGYNYYDTTVRNDTGRAISAGWFVVRANGGREMRRAAVPALAPGASAAIRFGQWSTFPPFAAAAQGLVGD
jgi:hypothetical protein